MPKKSSAARARREPPRNRAGPVRGPPQGTGSTDRARNMTRIPGGTFLMGSADFYPEERPVHRVSIDGFWMDSRPVTVEEFRRFVKSTGYVTVAERPLDPAEYPDADPALLVPGSLVFRRTDGPVDLRDYAQLVGVPSGCELAAPGWARQRLARPGAASGDSRRVRGRGILRSLGGQGTAHRGGMGVRGARRASTARCTHGAMSSLRAAS